MLMMLIVTTDIEGDWQGAAEVQCKVSLGLENTLLRGATLRDTEFVYGRHIPSIIHISISYDVVR